MQNTFPISFAILCAHECAWRSLYSAFYFRFLAYYEMLRSLTMERVHSSGNRKYYLKIKTQNQEDTKWYTNRSISQRDKNPWNIIERLYFTDSDEKCITFRCTLHVCHQYSYKNPFIFRAFTIYFHRYRQDGDRSSAHFDFF